MPELSNWSIRKYSPTKIQPAAAENATLRPKIYSRMTLFFLFLSLVLIWMVNYIFGKLFPPKAQRGVLFLFFAVLGVTLFVVLFKLLKTFFAIAIPIAILLTFLVVSRRK